MKRVGKKISNPFPMSDNEKIELLSLFFTPKIK